MKKIWNWFVIQSYKLGFSRGGLFIGTKDEAFQEVRKMLGIDKVISEIEVDVKDIKWVKLK